MSTHVPAALDQGTGYGIVLGLGALFAFGKILRHAAGPGVDVSLMLTFTRHDLCDICPQALQCRASNIRDVQHGRQDGQIWTCRVGSCVFVDMGGNTPSIHWCLLPLRSIGAVLVSTNSPPA